MSQTLLIYVTQTSNRFTYIVSELMPAMGVSEWQITSDIAHFQLYIGGKINYSHQSISPHECWIVPHTLLFASNIEQQVIHISEWQQLPIFFQQQQGHLPFDIFSAAFYLISRYEEYLPHALDAYGRYDYQNSLAYQQQFLNLPLVEYWLHAFKQLLQHQYQTILFKERQFKWMSTFDIDIAYQYLGQPILKNIARIGKHLLLLELNQIKLIVQVLRGQQADPFDVFDWLTQQSHADEHIYFLLTQLTSSKYDHNIALTTKSLQKLVSKINKSHKLGLHPSWCSNQHATILEQEKQLLESHVQVAIQISRQHYIYMKLPETYHRLISLGIEQDYSMGYGSTNGFRASYSLPFKWYDLVNDTVTSLTIHPFCFMDANAIFEHQQTPTEALAAATQYIEVLKKVNGVFTTIFHNHFLAENQVCNKWRSVYIGINNTMQNK